MRGALLLALALGACQSSGQPRAAEPKPEVRSRLPVGVATLTTQDGRTRRLDVEIAARPAERTMGLMFRDRLAEDAGMVFVFPEAGPQAFWMVNTLIPLDMIFIDAAGLVLGVVERAEPHTRTSRTVPGDAKYVLEVNSGWAARNNVDRGDHFELVGRYTVE